MSNTARNPNPEEPYDKSLRPVVPSSAPADISTTEEAKAAARNFSIVVGGPVYDFFLRIGLVRRGLPNVRPRVIAFVAIAWLPLLVLSIKDGLAIGDRVTIPLLLDFSTYGRLLLALPLLLLAEVVIDPAIRSAVEEFVDEGIVPESEYPAFENVLHRVQRWRDSAIPELILLALAFFPAYLLQHEWKPGIVTSWHSTAQGLSAAGWWYLSISAPLFRFILFRWSFRYIIWALLLWRISRLRLRLLPAHPDHMAGLEFLSRTQARFGILFCALGCAFAGPMANSVIHEGAPFTSFKFLIVVFLALSVILGICPLVVWAPRLARARQMGLREYAKLGTRYTKEFDQKWVRHAEPPTDQLLGSADIQSLADMGASYDLVRQMSIAPITKGLAVQLAVFAALPLIPLVIYATPTGAVVNAIMKMIA
jgi:hypothetical protein